MRAEAEKQTVLQQEASHIEQDPEAAFNCLAARREVQHRAWYTLSPYVTGAPGLLSEDRGRSSVGFPKAELLSWESSGNPEEVPTKPRGSPEETSGNP